MQSGHFTTVPCLNRKSMHRFLSGREGAAESLSPQRSLQGPKPTKKTLKTCSPKREGNCLPLVVPSSKVSGGAPWPLDKAGPIVRLSMPASSPPVPPNQLSATESKDRKGTQKRGEAGEGADGLSQAKNRIEAALPSRGGNKVRGGCGKLMEPHGSFGGFPGGSVVKNPPANAGDSGSIPGTGGFPGKGNGNHTSIPAWEIPWTEEPGRLQSMRSQKSRTQLSNQTTTTWLISTLKK